MPPSCKILPKSFPLEASSALLSGTEAAAGMNSFNFRFENNNDKAVLLLKLEVEHREREFL